MASVLVIAPHPDDETLGCGGTLLKHIAQGDEVHWCIVTCMDDTYSTEQRAKRDAEIKAVENAYGFASVHILPFSTAQLDTLPKSELVGAIKSVFSNVNPEIVYLPFPGDIHSDHAAVFEAASASLKWFRQKSVKRALCYETLSETDFQLHPLQPRFEPNVFIGIEDFIDQKIEIMKIFESEMHEFPFPRSEKSLRALATLRGGASGNIASETFMLLKEIID